MGDTEQAYFVGVDVGTGSVRAALVDIKGKVHEVATKEITVHNPDTDRYVQSSADIWSAVCTTVKEILTKSDANPKNIYGIGFDATCSLVLV